LNLNGFTISSTAPNATGYAILLSYGLRNLTIANGYISSGVTNNGSGDFSGGGFLYGISFGEQGPGPKNVSIIRVAVSGVGFSGIYLGLGQTMVDSCNVRTAGGYGILAGTIQNSSVFDSFQGLYGDVVVNCTGESTHGTGLSAQSIARNCSGSASGAFTGVSAAVADTCIGYSFSGVGVSAEVAHNSVGHSVSGTGLSASQMAIGCSGSGNTGLSAPVANGCYGRAQFLGNGIEADMANNCYGRSGGGIGLSVAHTASGCYGFSASGTGLSAFIANSCRGEAGSASGIPLNVSNKYNMP